MSYSGGMTEFLLMALQVSLKESWKVASNIIILQFFVFFGINEAMMVDFWKKTLQVVKSDTVTLWMSIVLKQK